MNIKRYIINIIRTILKKVGLEVKRTGDPYTLALYDSLYGAPTVAQKPFYNIGAGSFFHPAWTNIDYISDWYGPVQKNVIHHDLMSKKPLPIGSATAEIVYTSHTIEHITDDAVQVLFKETHRVLKPGGIFRVTTGPDAETDFRALSNGDKHWFYWDNNYVREGTFESIYHKPATSVPLEERWLHHVASALAPNDISPSPTKFDAREIKRIIDELGLEKALDYFTSKCVFNPERPGNHLSWWTHKKISQFLEKAGFTDIYRSGYGQSVSPVLRNTALFDSTHPQISIYVEARKSK